MNFIEAVKILEKDCYSNMYRQNKFNKRVNLINGKLQYVEERFYCDHNEEAYSPTTEDYLAEDWVIERDEIVNGIRINDLKDKTIKHIEYTDGECFILTLSDGRRYQFSGDSCENVAWVVIEEITGWLK